MLWIFFKGFDVEEGGQTFFCYGPHGRPALCQRATEVLMKANGYGNVPVGGGVEKERYANIPAKLRAGK